MSPPAICRLGGGWKIPNFSSSTSIWRNLNLIRLLFADFSCVFNNMQPHSLMELCQMFWYPTPACPKDLFFHPFFFYFIHIQLQDCRTGGSQMTKFFCLFFKLQHQVMAALSLPLSASVTKTVATQMCQKTKEPIIDFVRNCNKPVVSVIHDEEVEIAEPYKYLGTIFDSQ